MPKYAMTSSRMVERAPPTNQRIERRHESDGVAVLEWRHFGFHAQKASSERLDVISLIQISIRGGKRRQHGKLLLKVWVRAYVT